MTLRELNVLKRMRRITTRAAIIIILLKIREETMIIILQSYVSLLRQKNAPKKTSADELIIV
jgi:hypothetical protein